MAASSPSGGSLPNLIKTAGNCLMRFGSQEMIQVNEEGGGSAVAASSSATESVLQEFREPFIKHSVLMELVGEYFESHRERNGSESAASIRELSKNIYVCREDVVSISKRIKQLVAQVQDESEQNIWEVRCSSVFGDERRKYIRYELLINLISDVVSTFQLDPEIRSILNERESYFTRKYANLTEAGSFLEDKPELKHIIENWISLASQGVVMQRGESGSKEAGIFRMLNRAGLGRHVVPVVRSEQGRDEKEPVFTVPNVETLGVKVNKKNTIKKILRLEKEQQDDVEGLCAIGIIHALIHCRNGILGHRGYIIESNGKLRAVCCQLGNSLIPERTVKQLPKGSKPGDEKVLAIALQTFLWKEPVFDALMPKHLQDILRSDVFIEGFTKERLRSCFKEGSLSVEAEKALIGRASHIHLLARGGKRLTLRKVYRKLYPDEMLFVEAAQRLKISSFPYVCPSEVITAEASKGLFCQSQKLTEALERLKAGLILHNSV